MKKYKVVFLDWNGTLSTSKFWGHLEKSSKEKDKKLFELIDKTLFGELRHLIKPWMRGETTSENVVKEVSEKSGIEYKIVFNEFVRGCEQMEYVTENCLKKIELIKNNGTKVVIATDNMDSFIRWTVPAMKLDKIFDDILDSFSLKTLKNDFEKSGKSIFFDEFVKNNKIDKGESIIIDDSEDKEGKIQAYGIDYLRINVGVGTEPALDRILLEMSANTTS